ncbi:hypothetical protein EXW96_01180 [Paenibacillus sp. JMULE4]|uniref:IS3 family transposase n=1 Tax=Paenibacillus sp. JMULE4 TaxID=2518342 RepID=UPI0015761CBA|nr:hypothetical protein [Paenibacillus sp. JMULE4]
MLHALIFSVQLSVADPQDCLSRQEFESYQDAYHVVSNYLLFYNQRRIHGSLYDLSPEEFFQAVLQQTVKPLVIKV